MTYIVSREFTSPKWGQAFARGCHGGIETRNLRHFGPVAMFGSADRWELLQGAIQDGCNWWYGDHAYFAPLRRRYYRCAKNAYQLTAIDPDATPGRFEAQGMTIEPWVAGGADILICPQSVRFFELMGMDRDAWMADTIRQIRRYSDRGIRVSEKKNGKTLDLENVHCVVAYTSASAIEAMLRGVPAITTHPCAASLICSTDLSTVENPAKPDRELWAWTLANSHWTLEEYSAGMAWECVR